MAAHGTQAVELGSTEPFNDYNAHRTSYMNFLRVVKYCVIGIATILILMAIFLA